MTPTAYRNNGLVFGADCGFRIRTNSQTDLGGGLAFNMAGGSISIQGRAIYDGGIGRLLFSSGDSVGYGAGCSLVTSSPRLIYAMAVDGTTNGRAAWSCPAPIGRPFDYSINYEYTFGLGFCCEMRIDQETQTVTEDAAGVLTFTGTDTNGDGEVVVGCSVGNSNVIDAVANTGTRQDTVGGSGDWSNSAGGSSWRSSMMYLMVKREGQTILELPFAPEFGFGSRPTDSTGLNTDIRWVYGGSAQAANVTAPPPGAVWRRFGLARFFEAGVI